MSDNKLKNFLVNGFQSPDRAAEVEDQTETAEEQIDVEAPEETEEETSSGEECLDEQTVEDCGFGDALKTINDELLKMRYILEDLRDAEPAAPELPDMSNYLTNREQLKAVTQAVERKDADSANRNMVRAMEQISTMREDFFKLCQGMRERIDRMSAADVLSSFEAYTVDMENILIDGGVQIGPFPYDKLNTLHQRIVDVIPTDDEELNGTIAERLSDGYKMGSKVLLKEKVKIYKFTKPAQPETAAEGNEETVSETVSETISEESEEKETETQEEKE